jgi:hypothetical protein
VELIIKKRKREGKKGKRKGKETEKEKEGEKDGLRVAAVQCIVMCDPVYLEQTR